MTMRLIDFEDHIRWEKLAPEPAGAETWTAYEAGEWLHMSINTVYGLVACGEFKEVYLGFRKMWRPKLVIDRDEVTALSASLKPYRRRTAR